MGTQYDQVVCDGSDISYSALSYLVELGHTKIGYVGEQNNEVRFSGYKDALAKLGLPFLQKIPVMYIFLQMAVTKVLIS